MTLPRNQRNLQLKVFRFSGSLLIQNLMLAPPMKVALGMG